CFFFSSRRRHTRFSRDWSSDVCSSDLGSPLPLTDGEFGPDGAMYFLTGGRELESDLYRVYHKDYQKIKEKSHKDGESLNAYQRVRREIETYHTESSPASIDVLWPFLSNNDRHIRYAARIALEHQAPELWKDRAFKERRIQAVIQSMVALARTGDTELQPAILKKVMTIDLPEQPEEKQLDIIRAVELTL